MPASDPQSVLISAVDWTTSADRLRPVREAVFVQEQGIPAELEWDSGDAGAVHLLACTGDGTAVGVIRMQPDGRIGRMAVLREWRGRGIGGRLLRAMLDHAAAAGFARVYLHAQCAAVRFYARRGFTAIGARFGEAGIPHQAMEHVFRQEDGSKS